jgi:hypothetical protein
MNSMNQPILINQLNPINQVININRMEKFILQPVVDSTGKKVLNVQVDAYCSYFYETGLFQYRTPGRIENAIWTLKNDVNPFPSNLNNAGTVIYNVFRRDLMRIPRGGNKMLVCMVPRAKKITEYRPDQLNFRQMLNSALNNMSCFDNGVDCITRIVNTRTTHSRFSNQIDQGPSPHAGITLKTCQISERVKGRDILLVDDVYTPSINIDEDCIQALLDSGAKSVTFYAVAKTIKRN